MTQKKTPVARPTQADVARLAGVSRTTVSYVLNNSNTISVLPETRKRIWDAVQQLGYVPNRMARGLRARKTYTIAGIVPDITNPYHPAFERGIQDVAERYDYDLVMYNTANLETKERKFLTFVLEGRADGLIGIFWHMTMEDFRPLLERDIPIVRSSGERQEAPDLPLDTLYIDNVGAARAAVNYLIEQGHRRIGMLAGELLPCKWRVAGYRQALAEHDIAFDESLVLGSPFTAHDGYAQMQILLTRRPRPTAVFCASDLLAMGALAAIKQAGLKIPDDVAVVGFDNIFAAELVSPPLTTIDQFQESFGRRAAEMLFERLHGQVSTGGRCVEMPYQLVVRESA